MFIVSGKSRYHPYPISSKSTLTARPYRRSVFSKPLENPVTYWKSRFKNGFVPVEADLFGDIELNKDQKDAYNYLTNRVIQGKPFYVFLSGPAGTGKSVVLTKFANFVRRQFYFKEVCSITSTTGISAVHVGGVTVHSLLGIFPNQAPFTPLSRPKLKKLQLQLAKLRVLIIDEISLITSTFLAQLDHRLQEVFVSTQPFGGISVVIFGDLLQLPPVTAKNSSGKVQKDRIFWPLSDKMEAIRQTRTPSSPKLLWDLFEMKELKVNVRTKNEETARFLEEIRLGTNTPEIHGFLHRKCRMIGDKPKDIFMELRKLQNENVKGDFMVLAPTVEQVKELNAWKINQAEEIFFLEPLNDRSSDRSTRFARIGKKERILVAIGSKVMITDNINVDKKLVNGVMGKIVDVQAHSVEIERFDNKKVVSLSRELYKTFDGSEQWFQFPISLAEAITVHKSQGMTFDGVVVVTKSMFELGSFYTAISRSRSIDSVRITNVDQAKWKACTASISAMRMKRNGRRSLPFTAKKI